MSRALFQNVRTEQSLKFPSLELHYYASQMFYIDRIVNNTAEEPWINIESKQLKHHNLFTSLFTKHNIKVSNFIINRILKSWKKILKILGVHFSIPRNTQIWNNPSIKIQNVELNWGTWSTRGIKHLSDITMHNRVQSELQNKFTLINQEVFRYLQLKNWITENFNFHFGLAPETFEDVLFKEGKK